MGVNFIKKYQILFISKRWKKNRIQKEIIKNMKFWLFLKVLKKQNKM